MPEQPTITQIGPYRIIGILGQGGMGVVYRGEHPETKEQVALKTVQHLGSLVDARADLYSVGCILFELLTGRWPFWGSSPSEIRRAHLESTPTPPSLLMDGIPPALDALVLRLLAKRPQDRLGHADDVASLLARLGAEGKRTESDPQPRAYLYRPALVGRRDVVEALEQRLSEAALGQGGLLLIGGESGVGKTRLMMELSNQALNRQLGNQKAEGVTLGNLAVCCHDQGRMEEAQSLLHRALALNREIGNRKVEGVTLGNLAGLYRHLGRMEEARSLYEQSLGIHRELGDRRGEGVSLCNLASLHADQGRIEEARSLFERALVLQREVGDRRAEGITLGNLANVDVNQGRMEEARPLYERAFAIHREIGNRRSEGIVLGSLADIHADQGRIEEAQSLYEQAIGIHREVGNRRSEGTTMSSLADLYREQGRMEEARKLYTQALLFLREIGNRRSEGNTLGNLAQLEQYSGDIEKGEQIATQGEALLTAVGEKVGLSKLLCVRGHLALARSQSSKDILSRAIALAQTVSSQPESELGKAIAALSRAQAAFEKGESHRLYQGELLEDIPAPVQRWLASLGLLPQNPKTIL